MAEQIHIFRGHLSDQQQRDLVREVFFCHQSNDGASDWDQLQTSTSSLKLELGISVGGHLSAVLPHACAAARAVFARSCLEPQSTGLKNTALHVMSQPETPLTGLALLYGPNATMPLHYDAPTQPGQRNEWLAVMTFGMSVLFRCNDKVLTLHTGDVLVMDSMAVLHGVEGVDNKGLRGNWDELGLPVPSRLGILLWQGRSASPSEPKCSSTNHKMVDGIASLFDDDE